MKFAIPAYVKREREATNPYASPTAKMKSGEAAPASAAAAAGKRPLQGASSDKREPRSRPAENMCWKGRIEYIQSSEQAEACCALRELLVRDGVAIGLDLEWWATFKSGEAPRPTATLQICSPGDNPEGFRGWTVYVLHLAHMADGLPAAVLELLQSERVLKAGVALWGDIARLEKEHEALRGHAAGIVDLGQLARRKLPPNSHNRLSLQSLCEDVLHRSLDKNPKIRCSNWETRPLSMEQLEYAASDAYASLRLFYALQAMPDRCQLPPPPPLQLTPVPQTPLLDSAEDSSEPAVAATAAEAMTAEAAEGSDGNTSLGANAMEVEELSGDGVLEQARAESAMRVAAATESTARRLGASAQHQRSAAAVRKPKKATDAPKLNKKKAGETKETIPRKNKGSASAGAGNGASSARPRLPPSKQEAYDLFAAGHSIAAVATARNLRFGTAANYLAEAVAAGLPYDWQRFEVPEGIERSIREAVEALLTASKKTAAVDDASPGKQSPATGCSEDKGNEKGSEGSNAEGDLQARCGDAGLRLSANSETASNIQAEEGETASSTNTTSPAMEPVAEELGKLRLRDVKGLVSPEVEYWQIALVLAHMKRERTAAGSSSETEGSDRLERAAASVDSASSSPTCRETSNGECAAAQAQKENLSSVDSDSLEAVLAEWSCQC